MCVGFVDPVELVGDGRVPALGLVGVVDVDVGDPVAVPVLLRGRRGAWGGRGKNVCGWGDRDGLFEAKRNRGA